MKRVWPWLAFAGWALGLSQVYAQNLPPAGAALAQTLARRLPLPLQRVLLRLDEINHLDAGTWRTHLGDLPHGEDLNLNDSDWVLSAPGSMSGTDSVWYRRVIEIPKTLHGYDLTGARIWFRFQASAHGPVSQTIYFNGRRVALGDDLEPILLFDSAEPGAKLAIAVKLERTVSPKTFTTASFRVAFADARPDPETVRAELLSALVLLPHLSKNLSADEALVEKAISSVDIAALDSGDQARFDASLDRAEAMIAPLRPLFRTVVMHEVGNAHIDAAWLWPWTETVDVVRRTFSTALQLMEEYRWYSFSQSAAAYYEWIARKYPALNDQIKERISQGRWEVVGGMWVEPDLNMPDGESLARSILIAKRFFEKEYGVDVKVGWNPDSFGYNWQMPQIYKKSGIDYFVTQKLSWNDTNQLPFKLFWWQSPDGSKVLSYFPHGYVNTDLSPVRLAGDYAAATRLAPGLDEMMDLYGVGDHGGGPTRAILDEGQNWLGPDKIAPSFEFGTALAFFKDMEAKVSSQSPVWDYDGLATGYHPPPEPSDGKIAIPTMDSELYLEFHRGVFTTQAQQKRNMRQSEEEALNAEKLASLAWLQGEPYPSQALNESWKKITFNQFHDLAAGSGIGVIYQDAQKDYDDVRLQTDEITRNALHALAAHIDVSTNGVGLLIFNPLAWQRSGLVEATVQMPAPAPEGLYVRDSNGRILPSQILAHDAKTNSFRILIGATNVASLGYQVVQVQAGRRHFASDLKADGLTLENSLLRVRVDPKNGCITSLYEKRAHFEALAAGACGNQLEAFSDLPRSYDAWNIDPGTLDAPPSMLSQVDSVALVEKGPLRAVIRVARHWQNSTFSQDIALASGSDEVDIVNDIDWHENHVLLKAAFALAAFAPKATFEIPYGTIARPTTRDNSWQKAQFEVPALRWADLGDASHGFSLINDSKYGYDAKGNILRLSLLRAPSWPDPNADRGHHHFAYALYPHPGDWRQALTVRHGYGFNYKLLAMVLAPHRGSLPPEHGFVAVQPENVALTALKKAEDGKGLILHMYEWAGQASIVDITVPPGASAARLVNLMEQPQGAPLILSGGHVSIAIKPYEIMAVRFDYPSL